MSRSWGHTLIAAALLSVPCFYVARIGVADYDIWWHLRTADWILDHQTFPIGDPFSPYDDAGPWTAYSWLFEFAARAAYHAGGLTAIAVGAALLGMLTVASFHLLFRELTTDRPTLVILTAVAGLGLSRLMTPRPWLISIAFTALTLAILLHARRTGRGRVLYLLAPLFALWVNIHIQFITGLVMLGAAWAESIALTWLARRPQWRQWLAVERGIPIRALLPATLVAVAATLLNPYHARLYLTARDLLEHAKGLGDLITELQALHFRDWQDWLMLASVFAGAAAVGWRRRVDPLLVSLGLLSVALCFRSSRDLSFGLMMGLCLVASLPRAAVQPWTWTRREGLALAAAAAGMLLALGVLVPEERYRQGVAKVFPVEAAAAYESFGGPGKVFTSFDWGGYLLWRLPEAVVPTDGRTLARGEARILRCQATLVGRPGWRDDPDLAAADAVIIPVESPLAQLLRLEGRFEPVYEDALAVLFVARRSVESTCTRR